MSLSALEYKLEDKFNGTVEEENYIGKSVRRLEDARLLIGEGTFIDDLSLFPKVLHAAILRSVYPHAYIKKISLRDPEKKLKGVVAIVTGQDLIKLLKPFPVGVKINFEYYPIAIDRVRYVGEPVAVVLAENRYLAEDAIDEIEVEYEPLPPVVDIEEAIKKDSPKLHPNMDNNIAVRRNFNFGDVDGAFANAYRIVKGKFRFPKVSTTPIETYGVIANYEKSSDSFSVWSNFHGPFSLHSVMSAALGVPENRLRVIVPRDIGGSYGIKSAVYPYMVLIAATSKFIGKPIKWVEDRQESLMASSSGTDRISWVEAAVERDGTITGLKMRMIDNVGAYLRAPEPACLFRTYSNSTGAYRIKNIRMENVAVMTNKSPTGLIRGYGGPQLYFALERMVQKISVELGIDHAHIIRKNIIDENEFPYTTPTGGVYDSGSYRKAFELALQKVDYDRLRKQRKEYEKNGKYIGIGLAVVVEPSASNMGYISIAQTPEERVRGHPKSGVTEAATVSIDPSGSISVIISTVPSGQGHETVAAQIVSDVLGSKPDNIKVIAGMDTGVNPWTVSSGSYSSRFAPVAANAIYLAAQRVREKLIRKASEILGCNESNVKVFNGKLYDSEDESKSISIRGVAGSIHWDPTSIASNDSPGIYETVFYNVKGTMPPDSQDKVNASATYGFVADAVVVEVDARSGRVKILDYVTVHDAGKLLNPMLADGQILGGATHGLGAALLEELSYGDDGEFLSGTFMDYMCPLATDIPSFRVYHIETPSPVNILGTKGLGEGNTMSTPAAIANAITDALLPLGVEVNDLPVTPYKLWNNIKLGKSR